MSGYRDNRASTGVIHASLVIVALLGMSVHARADAGDGAALFKAQCATCHAIGTSPGFKLGPNLKGVFDRKPGTLAGYRYSAGFAKVDFVWDQPHLDAWLTNPQKVIPGAIMIYHQPDAAIRNAIISYLKTTN